MVSSLRLGIGLSAGHLDATEQAIQDCLARQHQTDALAVAHDLVEAVLRARLRCTPEYRNEPAGHKWTIGTLLHMALYYRLVSPSDVDRFLAHSRRRLKPARGEKADASRAARSAQELLAFARELNHADSDLFTPPAPTPIFSMSDVGMRRYVDPARRFSVCTPVDWRGATDSEGGLVFTKGSISRRTFSVRVVSHDGLRYGETLADHARVGELWRREFAARGYDLAANASVDGFTAMQFALHPPAGRLGGRESRLLLFIARGNIHTLTFETSRREFSFLAPIFEEVLRSYRVGLSD